MWYGSQKYKDHNNDKIKAKWNFPIDLINKGE